MTRNYDLWPYGRYHEHDGIVVFNRRYEPIVRCSNDGIVKPIDPTERIKFVSQSWFYADANAPRRSRQTRKRLGEFVATIPALAAEIQRRAASA